MLTYRIGYFPNINCKSRQSLYHEHQLIVLRSKPFLIFNTTKFLWILTATGPSSMEVRAQTFPSRSISAPQALNEIALDCMNPGEQEFLQNLSATQDWLTIENTLYQAPSGTSSLWLTDGLSVSCNFTDSNLFFASEPSIEAQSELGPSPTARQTNFTNATAPAEPRSLTALSNDESPSIITSSKTSLIWMPKNNIVSPTSPSASRQTRRVKKGLASVPNVSRKRGRPRKDCSSPEAFSPIARRNSDGMRRIPHNEVERKYREGLNASLRKLQCAVPSISQLSDAVIGTARPSKAVVIDSAIEYIHRLEKERDKARFLLERFRKYSSCTSEDAFST